MNWTQEEAFEAYGFHMDTHYALNLKPVAQDLSLRTLERYLHLFEANDLAKTVMSQVATTLVAALGLRVNQQRLDSTHLFSDIAHFGRTRLMGVVVKRFLTQLKRHDGPGYQALDDSLRRRYAPSVHQLFADVKKDSDSRRQLRQQVTECPVRKTGDGYSGVTDYLGQQ